MHRLEDYNAERVPKAQQKHYCMDWQRRHYCHRGDACKYRHEPENLDETRAPERWRRENWELHPANANSGWQRANWKWHSANANGNWQANDNSEWQRADWWEWRSPADTDYRHRDIRLDQPDVVTIQLPLQPPPAAVAAQSAVSQESPVPSLPGSPRPAIRTAAPVPPQPSAMSAQSAVANIGQLATTPQSQTRAHAPHPPVVGNCPLPQPTPTPPPGHAAMTPKSPEPPMDALEPPPANADKLAIVARARPPWWKFVFGGGGWRKIQSHARTAIEQVQCVVGEMPTLRT